MELLKHIAGFRFKLGDKTQLSDRENFEGNDRKDYIKQIYY